MIRTPGKIFWLRLVLTQAPSHSTMLQWQIALSQTLTAAGLPSIFTGFPCGDIVNIEKMTDYSKRCWAFIIPIVSMWISDLLLNNIVYGQYFDHFVWFYSGSLFTYGAFALIVFLGMFALKKVHMPRLVASALGASAIFFIVSKGF